MVLVLVIGAFCTFLNQTILTTAFPSLMKAFDISTATVQWLTTGFLMVNGIMIPVSAYLTGRFNTKTLYLVAMSIFEVGTVMAWFAPSFPVILAGRLIQAVGVGINMPLMQTIMLSIFPPEKRGAAMGINGLVIGLAPAVGPALSGYIIDTFNWRALFGMIAPIIFLVILFGFFALKNVIPNTKPQLDWLSLVISTLGFGSMLYGFSIVGDKGWTDPEVATTIIVGVILVIILAVRQTKLDNPFLEFKVFKSKEFTLSTILSAITMMAMVGVEMVIPLYLQIIHGMSAFHSGLTLLFGALFLGLMSPITGSLFDRHGARRLVVCGMFILLVGTLPFAFLTRDTPIIYIIFLYAVRMFGISMVMMPVTTSGMNSLPFNLISHGTAVNNTFRQVATSVGTAIMVSVLTNVTNSNKPGHSLLTQAPLQYKAKMFDATLLGYHAAFWFAVAFSVFGLILAFFITSGTGIRPAQATEGKEEK
ncbi:MAG: MDR family MFS transporter [Limosilactobacillus sp.]|uniref:MDR family MFS transporter n=1 Tax=Limosilactobacillus sp. TaxID=2773925 RepID=UPI0026F54E2B|nr:MDR family MFS transporter [Limosilactobacillus sp.]